VGIVFIVTLKQALNQKVVRDDLILVAAAILLYIPSGVAAVLPDMSTSFIVAFGITPAPGFAARRDVLVSMLLFYAALALTALAVFWMMRRTAREREVLPSATFEVSKCAEIPTLIGLACAAFFSVV